MLGGRTLAIQTKDVIDLEFLSQEEILMILDTAKAMKEVLGRDVKTVPALRGKTVATLFYENSTRTRLSFELAAKYLSASTVNIAASSSSVAKGESLQDTGHTLDAMGIDMIIMRHNMSGAPKVLGEAVKARVVNAETVPMPILPKRFWISTRSGIRRGRLKGSRLRFWEIFSIAEWPVPIYGV